MNLEFKSSEKIGDIVARFPKASDIFKQYHIDFCCGGDRPLSAAINEQNLNEQEVLEKLTALYNETSSLNTGDTDWTKAAYSQIIDHVVNTHHAYLNVQLPKLSDLTTKILRVHGDHHPELKKVHRLFHNLKLELEQHLIKEEEVLFPLIKEYEKNQSEEILEKAVKVLKETEDEHDAAGDIIKELRKITNNFTAPEDGCTSYNLTYIGLEELESDLFQHIHLENNILFKRVENQGHHH
jgi:regulator of cell morphogenesis and NO signaling